MQEHHPVSGNSANFFMQSAKKNGERTDCIIELETCSDFGNIQMQDIMPGQGNLSLLSLRQMVKQGRPAVVIIMPPGMKFQASDRETFAANLKRLSDLRPIIMAFGGK